MSEVGCLAGDRDGIIGMRLIDDWDIQHLRIDRWHSSEGISMQQVSVKGSCLCGSVRFEIRPPVSGFRYCHCGRCRKATGSAHAANIFLPESQFRWLAGESLIKRFNLPGAKRFAVCFCTQCGSRVPHKIPITGNVLIPAGLLESDPGVRPDSNIFWGSRAKWCPETAEIPKFDEYPG